VLLLLGAAAPQVLGQAVYIRERADPALLDLIAEVLKLTLDAAPPPPLGVELGSQPRVVDLGVAIPILGCDSPGTFGAKRVHKPPHRT
jgi:hypothetical protein